MATKSPVDAQVTYSRQYRRCGKQGCRVCAPGMPGHGPYWYAYWREGGRPRSRYLGREAPPVAHPERGAAPAGSETEETGVAARARTALPPPTAAASGVVAAGAAATRRGARHAQVPESGLRARTLGGFAVWLGEAAVPPERWGRPTVAALFKALLSAPGYRLTRDQAQEALWPGLESGQGATRLRATLYRLRQVIGPAQLAYRDETLALLPGAADWLDAAAFEVRARAALAGRDAAACRAALALYGGEYLPDDAYADWAVARREDLRQRRLAVLLHAAALCEEAGETEEAAQHLRAVLAADRCHEGAARSLMRIHVAAGRTAEALRVYRRLADALRDELDLAPEPLTRSLHRSVLEQRPAVAPATPAPPRRTNLPAPSTTFIGRRQELAAIRALLQSTAAAPDPEDRAAPCRLLTLVGPGGVGKTRLALEVADDLLEAFPDGVWLVDLAPLADPALVAGTMVRALGLAEEPGRPPEQTLMASLQGTRQLVLLDNCEHLIESCAILTAQLLATCPALRIVATSRERLAVPGEHVWPVYPLSLPDAERVSAGRLPGSEAARLFLDRARAQRPDLPLTDEAAATIARICTRLAGIPLAIELAAARVGVLGLEAIAARLEDSLRFLVGGPRTALPRHRTLRATLSWSWELLDAGERALLRRLSVFAGGCAFDAAAAVCAGQRSPDAPASEWPEGPRIAPDRALDLLEGLGRKSLLLIEERDGAPRYGLLEMVRQYGLEQLAAAGELAAARSQHLTYFLALVELADAALRGPEQSAWLARLEIEHHNLRAALAWARERGAIEEGLQLVGVLTRFWQMRGHQAEGLRWAQIFLEQSQGLPGMARSPEAAASRARALRGAGILAGAEGENARALSLYEESLGLLRPLGDRRGIAMVLNNQARVHHRSGDPRQAERLFEESLALLRALDDRPLIAMSLTNLGTVARSLGDLERATSLHQEALAMERAVGNTFNMANALHNLGALAFDRGAYGEARGLFEEGLALYRDLGNRACIAQATQALGAVAFRRGDLERARCLFEEAIALRRELGDSSGLGESLHNLGVLAYQQGDDARAERLFEEGSTIRRHLGERAELAMSLGGLALVAARRGDARRAEALFDEAIPLARTSGYRWGLAWVLHDRGWAAVWRGDHARAGALFAESLALLRDLGDLFATAGCLDGLSAVACGEGRQERAALLLGAAAALREAIGVPVLPMLCAARDRTLAETRAALGEASFADTSAAGRALSAEEAIASALAPVTGA